MRKESFKKTLRRVVEEYKLTTIPIALEQSQTSLLKELFEEMKSHPGITKKQKNDYMFLYMDILSQVDHYQTLINTNPKP